MDPLSVIASVIAITGAIATSCKTIGNISGLPKAFRQVQNDLPLVQRILDDASQRLRGVDHTDDQRDAIMAVVKPCLANAEKLKLIFQELESKCKQDEEATWTRARVWYREAIRSLKAHRVESLMSDVLKGVEKLVWNELFRQATQKDMDDIKRAIKELSEVEPSLDDSELANAGVIQASQEIRDGAKGQQNNVQGGTNTFHSGEGHVFTGPMSGVTFGSPQAFPKLDGLDEAAFNASSKQHMPSCLDGTRQQLLSQIREWVEEENARRIYWLKGMAGTGKSTIALTVAREYADKGRLGASFFFARGGGDLALTRKFAATIAAQLAEVSPDLRKGISDSAAANPRINSLGLYDQWEKLVLQPLARAGDNMSLHPLLVVVDALDECENDDDVSLLIQCLTSATSIDGIRLHILITSRPDQSVNFAFDSISAEARQEFILHDIEQDIVDSDLAEYYKTELTKIERQSGLTGCLLSDDTVNCLVRQSCGLFIHAATVCRFIRHGRQLANHRLSLILHPGASSLKPERELDQMYTTVLTHSFGPHFDPHESAALQSSFCYIVGSMLVLLDTMSPANLAGLLSVTKKHMTKEHIKSTLRDFHSVLDVPEENDKSIRLLHPSFRDFLLNPARCLDRAFLIDAKDAHGHLFNCCLQLMSSNLRKNMCRLRRPDSRTRDTPKADVNRRITFPVQYACRYWIYHLVRSNIDPKEHAGIADFFRARYLFWVEALSLIGRLADGISAIKLLETKLAVGIHVAGKIKRLADTPEMSETSETTQSRSLLLRIEAMFRRRPTDDVPTLALTVYDARRFIQNHSSIIEQAPMQIYCSAILFSPAESITRTNYSHHLPKWISRFSNVPDGWDSHPQTVNRSSWVTFNVDALRKIFASLNLAAYWEDGGKLIYKCTSTIERALSQTFGSALAFSPSGVIETTQRQNQSRYIVEGVHTLQKWDACLQTIDTGSPTLSLSFSSKDGTLASASTDNTVQLWDPTTGACRRQLKGHNDSVMAVAFSPEGGVLASCSRDRTIRLWDPATGDHLRTLGDDCDSVRAIATAMAFSPDGKMLAAISDDETVRLWNHTECVCQWTLKSHDGSVVVATSPDRKPAFDQGSTGKTSLQAAFLEMAIAFSPDGTLLAFVWFNKRVQLWDPTTGTIQRPLIGHTDTVLALAFSPVGKMLASSSDDLTIRLWDLASGACRTLQGYGGKATAIAFSPDGKVLASTSEDGIRLWDQKSGQCQKLLTSYGGGEAIVFSPDGGLLASASGDHTIRIWSPATEAAVEKLAISSDLVPVIAFSPDGKMLAASLKNKTLQLWDITTVISQRHFEGHSDLILAIAFSPDSKLLAAGSADGTIWLWNLVTGEHQQMLRDSDDALFAIALSPDGNSLASLSSNYRLLMWNTATGDLRWRTDPQEEYPFHALAFSPDGNWVLSTATSTEGESLWQLWNANAANGVSEWDRLDECYDIAFSPDGKLVAFVPIHGPIEIWDLISECPQQTEPSAIELGVTIAFSPNGTSLASVSEDNTIYLWDWVTGARAELKGPNGMDRHVAFSPDGRFFITNLGSLRVPGSITHVPTRENHPKVRSLIVDGEWLRIKAERRLWLPHEYRDPAVAVHGNMIALGSRVGGLFLLRVT